jgi:hypothetical protein
MTLVSARNIPPVGVAHGDHHGQRAQSEDAAPEVVGDRQREERRDADLCGQDAAASQQHAGRPGTSFFVPTVNRYNPQHRRVTGSGQCLSEPADPQQVRKDVLRTIPRNSGTTISPPGTLLTDFRIFMAAYYYLRRSPEERYNLDLLGKPSRHIPRMAAFRHMGRGLLDRRVLEIGAPSLMDPG